MQSLRTILKEELHVSDENVTLLYQAYADMTDDDVSRIIAFALLFGRDLYAYIDDGELSQYYNGKE